MRRFISAFLVMLLVLALIPGTMLIAKAESSVLVIDETNFPNESFRNYVKGHLDPNHDGFLSKAEIAAVKSISLVVEPWVDMSSIKGVEFFTELTGLSCGGLKLTELDVSHNRKLKTLYCTSNRLTSLDVSKNTALTCLECRNNALTVLDVSRNTNLIKLDCSKNQLKSLDVSDHENLKVLFCYGNPMENLNIDGSPNMIAAYEGEMHDRLNWREYTYECDFFIINNMGYWAYTLRVERDTEIRSWPAHEDDWEFKKFIWETASGRYEAFAIFECTIYGETRKVQATVSKVPDTPDLYQAVVSAGDSLDGNEHSETRRGIIPSVDPNSNQKQKEIKPFIPIDLNPNPVDSVRP